MLSRLQRTRHETMDSQRDARAALAQLEQYRLREWRETGRELGRGSYAVVMEVDYKGLKCAAKKIHRVLCEDGIGDLVSRFEEECRLLSQLRHPHVVQFLGIYFDPDSNLPVLVMEFLPTTLAQCLDTYGVLPEEINYGILRDVAMGLRYLHERPEPIVHRDLSANNVLLTSDMRAKISDLGVAKIFNLSAAQRSRMTRGPGTPAYMPPEATVFSPRYDVKVDIFSYGVMMVHSLCGRWPFPRQAVRVNPNNPADLTPLSEASRRQEYLDDIPGEHPLMQLIHLCLSNSPGHRPNASHVAQQVSEVSSRAPPSFSNKVELMESIRVDTKQKEGLKGENERLTRERDAAALDRGELTRQVEELHQQVANQGERIQTELREKGTMSDRVKDLSQQKEASDREKEVLTKQLEELRQRVSELGEWIETELREKSSLKDCVRELTRQKEASDREKEAKSLEVQDLHLQVADLQADIAQWIGSLAHKKEAYEQALSQKDQAHQQALQLKNEALASTEKAHRQAIALKDQAHRETLQQKDDLHQQALTSEVQAHREAMVLSYQAHKAALESKDNELSILRQTLALKDQAYQDALLQKDQALQLELAQKHQDHQQALMSKVQTHRETLARNYQVHRAEVQEKLAQLQGKDTALSILREELTSSCDTAFRRQETISQLRDQLSRCRTQFTSNLQPNLLTPGAKLVWSECAELPFAVGGAQAVIINGIVYMGGGVCISDTGRCTVCSYHPGEDKWAKLPTSPVRSFGVGQISGQLVLVGGRGRVTTTGKVTGDVHVFISESQQWEKSIPAMPTARRTPSVVSHSSVLIACGGWDGSDKALPTVELYKSETSQWYQCPPLPSPRGWMSVATIGETLFLVGGFVDVTYGSTKKSVLSASLSSLVDSATHCASDRLWTTLKDGPYYLTTSASIGGCLLSLGGTDKRMGGKVSTSIHTYLPTSSTWHQIGQLPHPLHQLTAVLLPTNELLIMGGVNQGWLQTKHVYKGSIEV